MQSVIRSIFVLFLLGFFTVASAQLPPEILADKHLIEAEQLLEKKDYAGAFKVMEKILALQQEHNLTLSDEFHFKYAQVALSADSTRIAFESVTRYLSATGDEGEFYKEALALLLEAEGTEISAEDMCTGKPKGSECWMELASHPECYVWDGDYDEDRTVTWSGKCSRNMAQGTGTLSWEKKNKDGKLTWGSYRETGDLDNGKKHGKWIERSSINEQINEGSYLESKKDGQWVEHNYGGHLNAEVKGSYLEGKKHGKWIASKLYGEPKYGWEGFFVEGKRHGHWVHQHEHRTREGPYIEDKRHGKWVTRFWSGAVLHGSYVEDKEHGEFYGETEMCTSSELSLKATVQGRYVEGKQQGYWKNDPDTGESGVGSGRYDEDGLKQGTWTFWIARCYSPHSSSQSHWGLRSKGDYIDGKKDGTWLIYHLALYRGDEATCWSIRYNQDERVEEKEVNTKICRQVKW